MLNTTEGRSRIPQTVKVLYSVWVIILVPIWIEVQGLQNFLWISDIGLLGTCVALWLESRFLASIMAIGVVVPDLGWTLLFLGRLLVDAGPLERSGYMFDDDHSLFVRGLSLYHMMLPPLLLWAVRRLGYDRRALLAQSLLTALLLPATYMATSPADNINFVFGFGDPPHPPLPQPLWLLAQILSLFLGAYLPTHIVLQRWSGNDS